MASRVATLAQAVTDYLNAEAATSGRFGESFAARRVYSPTASAETQKDLTVTVMGAHGPGTMLNRAAWQFDDRVLIGIEKRLPRSVDPSEPDGNATIDALTELAERVAAAFHPGWGINKTAQLRTVEIVIAQPDVARRQRRFLAVITLVFLST